VKRQTSSLPPDLRKMYLSHVWMKTFIICSEIVLGSWIKPLGFDLCHKDLGTIFPRYRPSQDNCSKYSTRRDIKVLTIADKTKAGTPQEGTTRTPKTETKNSPYQTRKPSITNNIHIKPSITEKKASLDKHSNTGDNKSGTLTRTSTLHVAARRRGHDLHIAKRQPTKEATTPVLRSVALKGRSNTHKEAPQSL
jgi:hypothetical protein